MGFATVQWCKFLFQGSMGKKNKHFLQGFHLQGYPCKRSPVKLPFLTHVSNFAGHPLCKAYDL
jgi:hypothetical protein